MFYESIKTTMSDIDTEVEKVKKELVELIIANLRQNKIDKDEAQKLAADFLAVLPIENRQDLLLKLKNLSSKYPAVNKIYAEELEETGEEKTNKVLAQMRDHIKNGNMEEAINVAKSIKK